MRSVDEAIPEFEAFFVGRPSMNHADAETVLLQVLVEVTERVSKAAEEHHLVVWQILFVSNNTTQCFQFWIVGIQSTHSVHYAVNS